VATVRKHRATTTFQLDSILGRLIDTCLVNMDIPLIEAEYRVVWVPDSVHRKLIEQIPQDQIVCPNTLSSLLIFPNQEKIKGYVVNSKVREGGAVQVPTKPLQMNTDLCDDHIESISPLKYWPISPAL